MLFMQTINENGSYVCVRAVRMRVRALNVIYWYVNYDLMILRLWIQ